jgi:hypothetical protein
MKVIVPALLTDRRTGIAAVVVPAFVPGEDRGGAAALAPPGLAALLHGDAGYDERGYGIGPPEVC